MGPMVGQKARVGDERAFDRGPFVGVLDLKVGADQRRREEKHQEEIQQDLLRPRELGKRDQFSLTCRVGAAAMGTQPRSIVHYGMAGMKGAPAGAGSGWGLAERSQFGVKWFGARGVETGDLRVRRPGRTRRAGRGRGRLWPGAFLRPGWHDRGRGGWHRGGTGVWRSSSGCRRQTVRGETSRGRY